MSLNISQMSSQFSSMNVAGHMFSPEANHGQSAQMFPPDSGANGDCAMGGQNSQSSNNLLKDLMKLIQDVVGLAGKATGVTGDMMG